MQDRSSYAANLVIVAYDDFIEVAMSGHLIRFVDADPRLIATVKRSVAFPPLWRLLRYLTSPGLWPPGESELHLPASVLESALREANVIEAA